MLNPKHQAKLAVLKHISGLMDGMMSDKMKKKPLAAHMEVDMAKVPHEPGMTEDHLMTSDPLNPEGSEHPGHLNEKEPGSVRHAIDAHLGQPEENEEDLNSLHDLYSKLQ